MSGLLNGDYVSDMGGMNTAYRYFIEVPPGVSRLVVEVFDPDIGLGGANEDLAGRDRDRGNSSPTYDTSATYSLFNPSGSARTTSFTAGSLTMPAGSDNAWTTFFDSSGDDYRDNFGSAAYNNSDGLVSWTLTSWSETNDDNNAGNGDIRITGGELRLGDDGSTGASAARIERQADLSAFGGATFSFNLHTQEVEANDQYQVAVSSDGGANWTTLETFMGTVAATSRSYDISAYRATNTRIRFIHVTGYTSNDFLFVDNIRIQDTRITPGHWELRADMGDDDDINAVGIRAHDGTSDSGGTELNVYFDSMAQLGVNPTGSGTNSRSYTIHPYVTSGCTAYENDFDYDGSNGSASFASRSGAFSQSVTTLSGNNVWHRNALTGWTSDTDSLDYGIWTGTVSISSYLVGGTSNGNYTTFYMSNSQAADPNVTAPAANPTTNAFRVYLPNDAGAAPSKPYVEQLLRHGSGPNPPLVGQTSSFTVTVRLVNPTPQAITFSASNLVTANVPGSGAVYGGAAQVSQGSIVSQPSVGSTGNVTWNPGTLSAGATALLAYAVRITPTSSGQRIAATATPASGNGTRATYVDETGNTTQARATYTFGPLCELAVTQGLLTQAVVSSFRTYAAGDRGEGGVQVEWTTASEAGTAGFNLSRWDERSKSFVKVHDGLLPGLIHAPQGGTYRFVDDGAAPGSVQTYLLEEVEVAGGRQRFGPFTARPSWDRPERAVETFEREPHKGIKLAVSEDMEEIHQVTGAAKGGTDGVRLAIRENGLYYLSSSQLASWLGTSLDETEKAISKGRLLLTRNGVTAAWYPDYTDAKLKTARGLYFYGETVDSLYSRDTVYRLRSDKDGLTMQAAAVTPAAPASGGAFPESQASEVDAFPATAIAPDPESDYWYWAFLVGGDPTFGHQAFTLDAPGLAAGDGTLTVNLQGATDTHVAGEHRAAVSLNGTPLGEIEWQGIAPQQGTFPVPSGVLQPAGNQVEVTATAGNGAPFSIQYVDGFRLGYPRTFAAAGDALAFTGGGNPAITVTGFSGPAVKLVDISNPLRPRWLTGALVDADAGTYQASFVPSAVSRYLAAGPGALKTPAAARPWNANDLLSTGNRADVLIVVPAGFESAAERLANLRRSQGLQALVVNLDQVADGFGEGVATPQALKAFLRFAKLSWAVPPRYVVLGGEGSLDYRNLQGYGDCVMPPLMIQGEGGLFPSDNRFADTTGDGLPDMALGRLPVLTPAELNACVDKILAYEASGTPAWAANALMLADSPDGAADFSADSDGIASLLPPGSAVDRIYLSGLPLATARAELIQGIQDGASWINYLGHGGLDRFSAGGLLTSADVPGLANGSRLPVVTAMTCTINRFAVPGVPSLGEVLVKSPTGGAAAVWGPSGLSYHGEARQLAEVFYRLASESGGRLGDSVVRSLAEYGGLGGDGRMLDIYNLLGDPALLVRRGPAPAGNGGGSGE
ncbi:MAG TPA: C25 family cysteine peptidase [Thermoanaerobaculia bacterium]|nr:C25 family cysteine peptidase [Thermoanaerobaculia bacterium]